MEALTLKEWHCLNEYIKDLLEELKWNGDLEICDQYDRYTLQELIILQEKILKNINYILKKQLSKK